MLIGLRGSVRSGASYPWDYRVEYLQIASLYPLYECGPLCIYNSKWPGQTQTPQKNFPADMPDTFSDFPKAARDNLYAWQVYSFPNAISSTTDEKTASGLSTICCYPYNSKYNMGMYTNWNSCYPSPSDMAKLGSVNTRTMVWVESVGTDTVEFGISQGSHILTSGDMSIAPQSGTQKRRIGSHRSIPVISYEEGGSLQTGRNVYVGTRFYEFGFDLNIPNGYDLHTRWVPCVKDNTPAICEVNSGRMIFNSGSGSVTCGPEVPNDFDVVTDGWGGHQRRET